MNINLSAIVLLLYTPWYRAIETQNYRFRPSTVSLSLALTYTLRRGIAHALVRFSWRHTDHQLSNQVGYNTVSLRRKRLYWNISCNYIKSFLNRRVSDLYMLRQLSYFLKGSRPTWSERSSMPWRAPILASSKFLSMVIVWRRTSTASWFILCMIASRMVRNWTTSLPYTLRWIS